ncbi:unnamed protein product [Cochlearia groenlandica]
MTWKRRIQRVRVNASHQRGATRPELDAYISENLLRRRREKTPERATEDTTSPNNKMQLAMVLLVWWRGSSGFGGSGGGGGETNRDREPRGLGGGSSLVAVEEGTIGD